MCGTQWVPHTCQSQLAGVHALFLRIATSCLHEIGKLACLRDSGREHQKSHTGGGDPAEPCIGPTENDGAPASKQRDSFEGVFGG